MHREQDFEIWQYEGMSREEKIEHFKKKLNTYKKWGWEIPAKNCEKAIKKLGEN